MDHKAPYLFSPAEDGKVVESMIRLAYLGGLLSYDDMKKAIEIGRKMGDMMMDEDGNMVAEMDGEQKTMSMSPEALELFKKACGS